MGLKGFRKMADINIGVGNKYTDTGLTRRECLKYLKQVEVISESDLGTSGLRITGLRKIVDFVKESLENE